MADLKTITLPSGSKYNLADQEARDRIAALEKATQWLGITTTALTDGATTNPITINGASVTAKTGDIVQYDKNEFVFNGTAWQEFGMDISLLGALAYKNKASGSYTPAGSVSAPTISVTPTKETVNSITDIGTLPELTMTVENENLTIGFSQGTLPTKGANQTVVSGVSVTAAQPTFTGTADTIEVE